MAAKKKNTEGLAFLVQALKKNRNISYADAKAAAEKKGLTVWPIMFGKAKLMLGHVKAGGGAAKRAAKRSAGKRGPGRPPLAAVGGVRRGPGRPRKNPIAAGGSDLESIVAAVRSSQQELARFRAAIEKIQDVIAATMA